jgi:DNA-directed RNA polymerase subunit RPC12/RpoP
MKEFVKAVEKGDIILKDEKTFFPWEDVLNCKNDIIKYKSYQCPYCGEKEVIWIYFKSPEWTWENLCGRAGPLAICPKCASQVKFVCCVMN